MTVKVLDFFQKGQFIIEGPDFIEGHLVPPIYPRRIATYRTGGRQIQVNNRDEAVARFKQSNLLDCRISAYPYPVPEYKGINRQTPNFFLSDLDKKNFKTDRLFQQCLESTVQNFRDKLHGANPSILWSGGGYYLLQPTLADIVLLELSRKLMSVSLSILWETFLFLCAYKYGLHLSSASLNLES